MSGPRRALLSVYDKTGIADLAGALVDAGWELISSGGTARVIADAGLPVIDVADHTGSPIMLGHRVVTLHPKVHGGILADRHDPEHQADMAEHGIAPIDLVVGNLYPFGSSVAEFQYGAGQPEELIDIGGPAMVRAAAKNHAQVGVLVSPDDYAAVTEEIRTDGWLCDSTRRRLARDAFAHTAAYDAAIVTWFDQTADEPEVLPPTIHLSLERADVLRYGENPHQQGARYRRADEPGIWDRVEQHAGVALSYLNFFDADAAWRLAHDMGGPAAVAIIKHANPCGAAVGGDLATAYAEAFACDPRSAFGGVVACNQVVGLDTVEAMEGAAQADVILAPGFAEGVVDRLIAKRKNTRILTMPAPEVPPALALRQMADGFLVQEKHRFATAPDSWQVVTERQPTDSELADAAFAWRVCGHVSSNAIVLAKGGVAWGIGAGQQNRVESGEIAASKAAGRADGGACASDAFYPFPDGIHAAADAGAAIIAQPGGSVGDERTIAAANERGVAMVFTGERQFLH
ncbi:MAG: bifunctional phosphoribosylaminoimidazolecarboxamide formyltransferase/IMP cyclohydrolase [Acidimicrobiales bacterium]|nr:bifunctional phosphoribosylaminoimidazolecarboxamide formyltransferase/IMP cyclohydrolase [Acidimicrobiales bacterium]